ncbi:hypothetical protein [Planktotalea sp.]|nr:hypothetical protein [Planktotalea sp.]
MADRTFRCAKYGVPLFAILPKQLSMLSGNLSVLRRSGNAL